MGRLVKVTLGQLTDQELDDLTAAREVDEPQFAAEVRRLKAWRHQHPYTPPPDERVRFI